MDNHVLVAATPIAFSLYLLACSDPHCPEGQRKIGTVCIRTDAAMPSDRDDESDDRGPVDGGASIESSTSPASTEHDAGHSVDASRNEVDASRGESDGSSNIPDPSACSACPPNADCVDSGGSVSCRCRDGYEDAGTSCADIDECAVNNGGCSANTDCVNTPGGHTCTCEAGFQDTHGDGTECVDKCKLANCDPHASCSIENGEAVCACPPEYIGDGKSCAFDQTCSLLSCDRHATCVVTGDERECKCQMGYSGSGTQCTNVNECMQTPTPCGANSSCQDTEGSYVCSCVSGYLDNGSGCQKVDVPMPCGPVTIASAADLDTNRLCSEIQGDLQIATAGLTAITASDFPYLTKVTGAVFISSTLNTSAEPVLDSVTLSKVQTAGALAIGSTEQDRVNVVVLPALTSLTAPQTETAPKNGLNVVTSYVKTLELPALATINGTFLLANVPRLCTLIVRNVTRVNGVKVATEVPNLLPDALIPITKAVDETGMVYGLTSTQVGCCISSSLKGCQSFMGTASCGC